MNNDKLIVSKIKNGTVIDHITAGLALSVLKILGISGREGFVVSVAMNVKSKKLGKKDIVKIENIELNEEQVNKIALISPHATINIIKDYKVILKRRVKVPTIIRGILRCINPNCITNKSNEPITPVFYLKSRSPLRIACKYCGSEMGIKDILKQFIGESSVQLRQSNQSN